MSGIFMSYATTAITKLVQSGTFSAAPPPVKLPGAYSSAYSNAYDK